MSLPHPSAKKIPAIRSFHGHEMVDDYEWLRDKDNPETIAYLEAENEYTSQRTEHLVPLQEKLFAEYKSRIKETDMSVPVYYKGYFYYVRTVEGQSYPISCRIKAEGGETVPPVIEPTTPHPREEIMLDVNELAEGHDFFQIAELAVVMPGNLIAYSTDAAGDERFTIYVKDLTSGELLDDVIEGTAGSVVWAGKDYFFYCRVDDMWRPNQVWRHKIGDDPANDVLVFEETDERFWLGVSVDRAEQYIYIESASKLSSEVHVIPFASPTDEPQCLAPRRPEVEYSVAYAEVGGDPYWLVMHNTAGPNFEIGYTPLSIPFDFDKLTQLIPHRDDVRITGLDTFASQILLGYRAGAIGRMAIMDVRDGFSTFEEVTFDEELFSAGPSTNMDWDARSLRMSVETFTKPHKLFLLDLDTGERTIIKEQEVLGGYNPDDYKATRLWAKAEDGARIPISLIHRADLDMNTPHPLLLVGYGSYEVTLDPGFSAFRLSKLDRGMIVAIAHIRGGGEMGRLWYDNGKMLTKRNTFTDFIAAADHLIHRGVTTPEMLVASGGSAGGLLMGAVANMAPEKFTAIEADVPFVDPLTSMLMPELPLTVTEWEEWGDPLHDPQVYEYMASYAPYDNVSAQRYPNILATTSLNDTRVLYVEPAKWVAKLRDLATGGEFLLKTEMAAGHGGVSGRYESWRQTAFSDAWIINQATGLLE
ncbi:S9 family peptidase [Corynebacterium choanae]|uniref:Protease 2 n=1 Tax=Corynebacterium choanae TaxID=1862358 RepID=A0A3G6J987_9CORY|nr:S9 family peptidase [Corynebacterium choanae]AZA14627.1 Protease 2 [Corynebacterium choanae]